MNNLITTGQFAKLCNVSKDTILYYDKIGLLKPDVITDNGYRYYNPEKYLDIVMIRMLSEIGISLKEIGDYMKNMDMAKLKELLDVHNDMLKKQKAQLDFRIKCNEVMNKQLEYFSCIEKDDITVVFRIMMNII